MGGHHESPTFVALVQATAGAAGGVFSSFVLMPVEVAKVRIQLSHSGSHSVYRSILSILDDEGPVALFRGCSPKCFEGGLKNFVYFYIYAAIHAVAKRRIRLSTGVKLALGSLAGAGATVATMPLEVLATRMQAETTSTDGFTATVNRIVAREGLAALYTGFWYNIMLCINPAIQNVGFDSMKDRILHLQVKQGVKSPTLSPFQAFILGALAKALATLLTYPLVRLKTLLQAGQKLEKKRAAPSQVTRSTSREMLEVMSLREDQPLAVQTPLKRIAELYRGLGSALTKTTLQAALMYMTKDQVAGFVQNLFKLTAKSFFRKSGSLKLGATSGRSLA